MLRSRRCALTVASVGLALIAIAGASACSSNTNTRARDIAGDRRPRRDDPDAAADGSTFASVPEPPRVIAQPAIVGKPVRVIAHAATRALALDATNIYYGDSEDDGVYAMPKAGGTPVRLARHTPVAGAIALDGDSITWIGGPGDVVLKLALHGGGQPTTLRDRGIFSDVATAGGDVFITEAIGAGGALLRVTGATAARLAAFDGPPRTVLADATHAYVVTPTKIFRTAHVRAELETIATGTGFAFAEMDASSLYVVAEAEHVHSVIAVPKSGGPTTALARRVRNAPVRVAGSDVYYFDAMRPRLLAVPTKGGEARLVSEDEALGSPTAIEADDTTIYVASGNAILAIAR